MKRLGLLAFATDTGLGIQTRALYENLKPAKTMLVDISRYNHMPVHADWYDYSIRTDGFPTDGETDGFLKGLDVALVCESPFNYRLFERAGRLGVRTVLQYNYEFLEYMRPEEISRPTLPKPDVLGAPSPWHFDDVARMLRDTRSHALLTKLPVPIELDKLPQRSISRARRFFHVAGRPAVHDRNGTFDFIAAVRMAAPQMPEATFTLYCQQPTDALSQEVARTPIRLVGHVEDASDMYRQGDVMVLPRRYGGLCLPAQEAIGCGIPVLMTDVSPNNAWMPSEWLVPTDPCTQSFTARPRITIHLACTTHLAQLMIDVYRNDRKAQDMHRQATAIAHAMSWRSLLPRYERILFGEVPRSDHLSPRSHRTPPGRAALVGGLEPIGLPSCSVPALWCGTYKWAAGRAEKH